MSWYGSCSAIGKELFADRGKAVMRKPTILCVDDEPDGLFGRETLLKLSGYEVVTTTSGRQSLDLLRSATFDAVVLDYRMPEMMGDVVAARMKKLKPDVPILMLSAHESLPAAALRSTDTFLSKNAPPSQFVGAVKELLAARAPFFNRWLQSWKRRIGMKTATPPSA